MDRPQGKAGMCEVGGSHEFAGCAVMAGQGGGLAWERLKKRNEGELVWGLLLSPIVYVLLVVGILELVDWAGWLRWPVAILLGLLVLMIAAVLVEQVRVHAKRTDTATQSIRSASQGRIELVGTLKPVGGEVLSPLYGVPCVSWVAKLTATAEARPAVRFSDSMNPAAVLLTDGEGAEVFLPFPNDSVPAMEIEIERPDEPISLLREDLRRQSDGTTIAQRFESLVPCGKPMQANAVFRTLSSADSYLKAVCAHRKQPEPAERDLQEDKVEQAWRSYCRHREEVAGAVPVPVDVLLPLGEIGGVRVVRQTFASWRETATIVYLAVTLGVACVFTIGALVTS